MALDFALGAEYIQTAGAFPEPSVASVCFWIFIDSVSGANRIMGTDTLWECRLNGSDFLHEFRQSTQPNTTTVFTLSTFYHIVCTYDGTNKGVYVDGIPDPALGAFTNGTNGSDTALSLGSSTWNTGQGANCALEDVRIYNRVISQKEAIIMCEGFGRDRILDGLIHWWPLNSGADGTIATFEPDIVGKQNMSVIVGSPTYIKSPRTYLV